MILYDPQIFVNGCFWDDRDHTQLVVTIGGDSREPVLDYAHLKASLVFAGRKDLSSFILALQVVEKEFEEGDAPE
jgi:hypothetical protein